VRDDGEVTLNEKDPLYFAMAAAKAKATKLRGKKHA
jgi:hypothetical protein